MRESRHHSLLSRAVVGIDGGKKLKYGEGMEGNFEEEMILDIDAGGSVEGIIKDVVRGVINVMLQCLENDRGDGIARPAYNPRTSRLLRPFIGDTTEVNRYKSSPFLSGQE